MMPGISVNPSSPPNVGPREPNEWPDNSCKGNATAVNHRQEELRRRSTSPFLRVSKTITHRLSKICSYMFKNCCIFSGSVGVLNATVVFWYCAAGCKQQVEINT